MRVLSNDHVIQPPARIGFIGLGKMGLPMAHRLMAAGFAVCGFDPSPGEAADSFCTLGGTIATSPAGAAQGADAVITMLPNGEIVRQVVIDSAEPVSAALEQGAILLEMSSSAPVATRDLGGRLAAMGILMVDAPVSGGVRRAENGSLTIMIDGDSATCGRVRAILRAMGTLIFETGLLGSGHAMKALNNYVSAAGLIAACEALEVGAAFGLDRELMTDILNVSTGNNNTTQNKVKQFILSGSYASGFALALLSKDVGIATELANQLRLAAPISHAVSSFTEAALDYLGPQADHTEVDRYLKALNAKDARAQANA